MDYRFNNAFKFVHPDGGFFGTGFGLQITANGKIAMISDRESIRQSILLLISTIPGERVMRPQYGCNLQQLAFMPNDATTHGLAIHYVKTALEQWEPRIDIIRVDADSNALDPNAIDITLDYRTRHLQQSEQLVFAYHLMGAEI